MSWWFIPLWLLFVALNMPIAFSLAIVSTLFLLLQGQDLYIIIQRMAAGPDSFPLLAVPFFIFAGTIMNSSGITKRIFAFARALVGHIPGGLGHVNVVASMIFAGMSGSAVADAAGLGTMEVDAMIKEKYDPDFSAAITAASSTIGPIVPPSIPMVIFGVLSGASVGQLFLGGFIPGVLMGLGLMVIAYVIGKRKGYSHDQRPSIQLVFKAFKESFWALLTPVIIMGGIISGIFTPTEAAVVTVAYALVISGLVYHSMTWIGLKKALIETIEFTGNIMVIVAAANIFGWILTRGNVPQNVAKALLSVSSDPTVIMLIIAALVLFLGCFMEGIAMMMILVPILVPISLSVGIDLVHLGVVFVLVQMIGLITPPFAVNIMIVSGIARVSFEDVVKAIFPMGVILVIVSIIVIVFPQFVMFLPNLLR